MMLRILAPHFVAGIIVGKQAAPIIRYMESWDLGRVVDYCTTKKWEVEIIDCQC